MYKSLGLQVRREGLTHDDYVRHWLNVHAPMSVNVADLKGYVANEVVLAGDALVLDRTHPNFGATFDGVAQLHFETEDGLKRMTENPAVQTWFADGPNFVGLRTGFITKEHVLRSPDRATRPFKAICFVKQTQVRLVQTLQQLASTEAGGLVQSVLGNATGSTNLAGFEVPEMDMAVELWGESTAAAIEAAARLSKAIAGNGELVGAVIAREWVIKTPLQ